MTDPWVGQNFCSHPLVGFSSILLFFFSAIKEDCKYTHYRPSSSRLLTVSLQFFMKITLLS